MKKSLFIFLVSVLTSFSFSQNLKGNWAGILIPNGQSFDKAKPIYLNFEDEDGSKGKTRIEIMDGVDFSVKSIDGKKDNNQIKVTEGVINRSSGTRLSPNCKLIYTLSYDNETGYLSGDYSSSDCRAEIGKVVLFRSKYEVTTEKEPEATHLWTHLFIRNYKKGYPAPEILKKEQENFQFQTIYFDFDEADIRPEFQDYLNRLARILDAIHDLRVKITGHTDGEGTDGYNIGLSERRADAIRDYFKSRGVEPEKLDIDFKGKREPTATNETPEGRQLNRRVVFEFI